MDILSMTGYGSAKGTVEGLNITDELKSVNNRYLDVSVRLPRGFLFAEEAIKAAVQQHISRGKVDVFLTVDSSQAADTVVRVNEPLLRAYLDALDSIAAEHGLQNDVTALSVARFPDVLSVEKAEADQDALRAGLVALMDEALAEYDRMRLREGQKLREDVESRLVTIEALVTEVETHAPETVEARHRGRDPRARNGRGVSQPPPPEARERARGQGCGRSARHHRVRRLCRSRCRR